MVGMSYMCLRCGAKKPTELRRSKSKRNPRCRYLELEAELKLSRLVHLHKTAGTRNLCPRCLREIVEWQRLDALTAIRK